MLITDLPRRQCCRQALPVELGIGARSRHRSHINNEFDAWFLKKVSKFVDGPRGVAYREKSVGHCSSIKAPASAYDKRMVSKSKASFLLRPLVSTEPTSIARVV